MRFHVCRCSPPLPAVAAIAEVTALGIVGAVAGVVALASGSELRLRTCSRHGTARHEAGHECEEEEAGFHFVLGGW
jgi:hypothetical protein